jgi:acylphosphatase
MKRRIVAIIAVSLILAIGFSLFSPGEEPAKEKTAPTPAEVIKKIEEQIFYPDQQETLESAEYTLIYGTQMLMTQAKMKLEYGNKAKAKGKEQGCFGTQPPKKDEPKKDETKKTDKPSDKPDETKVKDEALTWPSYEVSVGPWTLTDPVNLLMQIFIVPLNKTFPEDKWDCKLQEQDKSWKLTFTPKTKRPSPKDKNPLAPIVDSVILEADQKFVVNKIKLTFDQSFANELNLPGISKVVEDSDVEVTFTKQKNKLLIKEMTQKINSGSPNPQPPMFAYNMTPKYTFEFKEISGFLLPTVKDMFVPASQLSGTLGGMDIHFLVEYLDYKTKAKKKK